ncbi:MAG: glycoside hydrolase family 3 C-terminal domain-containing protein [Bacteroidales bacterium]|jgi:beta-glucosidase|nr:glycoside hydrolase family 3 C-terminal domain-containing protein [Bacteroidales bacterium]
MKRLTLVLFLAFVSIIVQSQPWPFQDRNLSEDERIRNLISLMSLDEKLQCLSTRISVPRLGVQGTRTIEGLHGLAYSGPANWAVKGQKASPTTTFPQAIGLAQMWDPEMMQKIADWQATEARYLAQNKKFGISGLVVFAPNADMGRDIRWGRTEECFGEDPFLNSTMVTSFVRGLQGDHPVYWKTASLMKHFLANSNENNRTYNSSDFDERLFREYYSYAFYKGVVEGGSQCYMAAYNKYNGIPCTVHPVIRNVTMNDWGLRGIVCTDGGAFGQLVSTHAYYSSLDTAAAECIKAGITVFLDNYMAAIKGALSKNLVTEKEIDEAIYGNLRVILKLGMLDNSLENPYAGIGITDTIAPWTTKEAADLVRKATVRSIVLLKNGTNLLPVQKEKIKSIAVIGPSSNKVISDWYSGTPPYSVNIRDGIRSALGNDVTFRFAMSNKADSAVIAARESDVAIVCVGNHPLSYGLGWGQNQVPSDGREDVDRQAISLEQEDLVKLVMKANPNTVLVIVSSFPYAINWSKANVPAILHVSQSSQELGNAVADVIFGKVSPAGRLVQTWTSSIDQLPPILDYNIRNGRTYMYDEHEPLFAFGHGLTYTIFRYSGLKTDAKSFEIDGKLNISFMLQNTGNYDSDEVAQLYVSFPGSGVERPGKALKGFARVYLKKGESKTVTIPLKGSDIAYWDTEKGKWALEPGRINFFIGSSSEDQRLKGRIISK